MKLSELGATFVKYEAREPHEAARRLHPEAKVAHWVVPTASLEGAHGVQFRCPMAVEDHGHEHAHLVRLWFRGQPVDKEVGRNRKGEAVRWRVTSGNSIETLTLDREIGPDDDQCQWSGSVRNGEVVVSNRPVESPSRPLPKVPTKARKRL